MVRRPIRVMGWCSGNGDNTESRYIQLGVSFFENENVMKLTGNEFKIYTLMVKVAGPNREFSLPRSIYGRYCTPSTFNDVLKSLIKKGFIELVYSGKCTREPSRYRFTFSWKTTGAKDARGMAII
jgi:hypothetical protein